MSRQALLPLAVVLLALAGGCATERRGVAASAREVVVTDPEALRGRGLFLRSCEPCHPGGEAGLGPALNNKPLPRFLIRMQVRLGLGAMPSFSREQISREDLAALATYVRALRRAPR